MGLSISPQGLSTAIYLLRSTWGVKEEINSDTHASAYPFPNAHICTQSPDIQHAPASKLQC